MRGGYYHEEIVRRLLGLHGLRTPRMEVSLFRAEAAEIKSFQTGESSRPTYELECSLTKAHMSSAFWIFQCLNHDIQKEDIILRYTGTLGSPSTIPPTWPVQSVPHGAQHSPLHGMV